MHLNWMALSVPFFTLCIGIEYYFSVKKAQKVFHFEETVSNLNVGIAERVCDLFTTGLFFYYFDYLHKHFAVFQFSSHFIFWIILLLLTDFLFYWYHRFGHRVNILWAAHVVHHQSEDYNYSTAVRLTIFQAIFRCLFWSFLPIAGFPAYMITAILLIHGAYPFFTHTQLIGKLGWLEYIFVTPSHHRVHHSSNPAYLDKNYGDVLIIWDKLFGTFAKEEETPIYGLTQPLKSHSFLWQHFHFFLEIGRAVKYTGGLKQRLKIIFGKPEDIDVTHRSVLEEKLLIQPDASLRGKTFLYKFIGFQLGLTLLILFFVILFQHYLIGFRLVLASLFIFLSVIHNGAMLQQKKWIFHLDFARLIVIVLLIYQWNISLYLNLCMISLIIVVVIFYKSIQSLYKQNLLYPLLCK